MCPDLEGLIPDSGRALDIACGRGAQTVWLAQRGLDVVALDVSDVAITLTKAAAETSGVIPCVDASRRDLGGGLPTDLGTFEIIICQRFRSEAVLESIPAHLCKGGTAFITTLSVVGLDREPGEHHAMPGELNETFSGANVNIVWHHEGNGVAAIAIRRTHRTHRTRRT